MNSEIKNQAIKSSLLATKKRRKTQQCKTFTLKFDISHMSNNSLQKLNNLLLQLKKRKK